MIEIGETRPRLPAGKNRTHHSEKIRTYTVCGIVAVY